MASEYIFSFILFLSVSQGIFAVIIDYDVYGHNYTNRNFQNWRRNRIIIPNINEKIIRNGTIQSWSFYAKKVGTIHLQLWRKVPNYSRQNRELKLMQQFSYRVRRLGGQTISLANLRLKVTAGDVIGFYTPKWDIIPYDGGPCLRAEKPQMWSSTSFRRPVKEGTSHTFYYESFSSRPCRKYSLRLLVSVKVDESLDPYTYGGPILHKGSPDGRSNKMIIPNSLDMFRDNGYIIEWNIYASRPGKVNLQIWRKISGSTYKLLQQTPYEAKRVGTHVIQPPKPIQVVRGDVLGIHSPGQGIINKNYKNGCSSTRTLFINSPDKPINPGTVRKFRKQISCSLYSVNLRISKPDEVLGLIGHDILPRKYKDMRSRRNMIIIPEPFNPLSAGHLIGWRIFALEKGEIRLQIWRPYSSDLSYRLVSETKYEAMRRGVKDIPAESKIPIQDGDLFGFHFPQRNILPFDGMACQHPSYLYVINPFLRFKLGQLYYFRQKNAIWNKCRRYSIALRIIANVTSTENGSEIEERKQNISTPLYAVNSSSVDYLGTTVAIFRNATFSDEIF